MLLLDLIEKQVIKPSVGAGSWKHIEAAKQDKKEGTHIL
jgi:hypothetical protein